MPYGNYFHFHNLRSVPDPSSIFQFIIINPRTAFWGPFGPQTTLTGDIFVIGLIYLLLHFII